MLAKNVNDNAFFLNKRGAYECFASKLAPTVVGVPLTDQHYAGRRFLCAPQKARASLRFFVRNDRGARALRDTAMTR
ncbi:hypothetical protein SAMN05216202_1897 [Pseudomonas mucidolens]|uniref:Uncharacterized protein n=1 Tax=Pseudomonas mucidolens TaxID=46679 RepID=A0A1H2MKX1_9PSED|nr:hypothetical protein SAMN05216202_1897 [Pseudomonas mucidolens]SQH33695.1 Uncharacterised protein [Pseudomonas mucidolens]